MIDKTTASEHKPKVLVIGLDGATFDLIEPWIASGKLPTLASLVEEGVHGTLMSIFPPSSCPAWKAFSTGKQPGKLGVYGFQVLPPDSCRSHYASALSFDSDELWDILGRHGFKCGVVNMPIMYPPHPINGFIVAGLLTPSERSEFTYPSELKQELLALTDYSIQPNPPGGLLNVDSFCRTHHRLLDSRTATFEYLMTEKSWDFLAVVYREVDAMQHHFWEYADESHPCHRPELVEEYGNVLLDYWHALDAQIGRLLQRAPEDVTVILMSDHGFGPLHWQFNINDWLVNEGFLVLEKGCARPLLSRIGLGRERMREWVERIGLGHAIRYVLPVERRRQLAQSIPKVSGAQEFRRVQINWDESKAFAVQGVNYGAIHLNTTDRPHGWIKPGSERENVRAEIISRLRDLRHPEGDEPAGFRIYKAEDLWRGDNLEAAPDILMLPTDHLAVAFDVSVGNPNVFARTSHHKYSATHRMEGILIAHGPDVRRGAEIQGARIVDLAPTILHLMGVPIPEDIDGCVLRTLFEPDSTTFHRAPAFEEAREAVPTEHREDKLNAEEQELIEERLRELGYL